MWNGYARRRLTSVYRSVDCQLERLDSLSAVVALDVVPDAETDSGLSTSRVSVASVWRTGRWMLSCQLVASLRGRRRSEIPLASTSVLLISCGLITPQLLLTDTGT